MIQRFEKFTSSVTAAYKFIQKIKNYEMVEFGLKGTHVMCLYFLGKTPDGLYASELCEKCCEDKAAVSRTLSELIDKGYVVTENDTGKKKYRAKNYLTESGKEINGKIYTSIINAVDKGGDGLNDSERDNFYKSFDTINSNLKAFSEQLGDKR